MFQGSVGYEQSKVMGVSGIFAGSTAILPGLVPIPVVSRFTRKERSRFIVVSIIVALGVIIWITLVFIAYFLTG